MLIQQTPFENLNSSQLHDCRDFTFHETSSKFIDVMVVGVFVFVLIAILYFRVVLIFTFPLLKDYFSILGVREMITVMQIYYV